MQENNDFGYASEKLDQARRILMAPHPNGESHSFMQSFDVCLSGLTVLRHIADESAQRWVDTIRSTIDTAGCTSKDGTGLWMVKAESLTTEQRFAYSSAVDELASWLKRKVLARRAGTATGAG